MVLMMEETSLTEDSSSDVEFACGVQKVEPRVGDEFQAKIPPMMSSSQRALFCSSPIAFDDDSSYSLLIGLPIQVMWIDKHQKGDDNVDMNQSLSSLRAKRSRFSSKKRGHTHKKQKLDLEAVPEIPSSSWEDIEVDSFLLGLYTFGKNFAEVKKFMESKGTGEIVLYYYSKFYNSSKYHIWSDSRKKRSRKCVYGRKLYSGWRQQQLLSRLIPSIAEESHKQMLVNVSKSFAEGKITLEKYITAMKDLVGLKLLVEAVAIGKGKEDLTVLNAIPMKTKPWFTITSKPSSPYTSLTSAETINMLTGSSRLSKARCNDIFWEAVWPRLLARGWHSEKTNDRGYFTSKDNIVFIVPGVKRFERGEHVKGEHYFDSVSDILTKVALEPELLEFETEVEIREEAVKTSSDQSDGEESPQSDNQRQCYLRTPSSNRGTKPMKFTVVDTTSLASGEKLCGLRNLKAESLVSEAKTLLGEKHSSFLESSMERLKVKKPQVDEPMRFTIIDTSLDHRERLCGFRRWRYLPGDDTKRSYVEADSGVKEEESLEKNVVKEDPSRRLIKQHKFTVSSSAPLLKRRRLSACIRSEESLSRESPELKHLVCDDDIEAMVCSVQRQNSNPEEMNVEKEVGTEPSSSPVENQEMSEEIEPHGINSSGQESKGQQQQTNTDGVRRQSTRKRPLTTRALEALESSFLTTTKRVKSTTKPRKRDIATQRKHSDRGEDRSLSVKKAKASKPLDQIEDSKPTYLINETTTESKAPSRIQESKPVLTEHPKLPPIVLKFSFKRHQGDS